MHPRSLLLPGLIALMAPADAQEPVAAENQKKAEKPALYDPAANAEELTAKALKIAKRDNKRVLLMFGGNWCGWCHKLHGVLKSNAELSKAMTDYQLVMVDIGKFDHNVEFAAKYGADFKSHGVPYLTVLDSAGKVITHQDTGSLEDGPNHDPNKVLAFLTQHKPTPLDAHNVLAAATERAAKGDKMLFVHLGAPWCGWCHRLEDFMARPEIEAILALDFVDVKIDVDRMTGGQELQTELRGDAKGGIPWFVFMTADGTALIDSDGPEGNIGFPFEPKEIAHFIAMLQKVRKKITAEQVAQIEKALQDARQAANPARGN